MRTLSSLAAIVFIVVTVSPALAGPQTAGADPVRLPSGVMAGQIIHKVEPEFPEEARRKHINGTVVIHMIVTREGIPRDVQAISGPEVLRENDVKAVQQWRYRPYLLNGQPVEVETLVTISVAMNGG